MIIQTLIKISDRFPALPLQLTSKSLAYIKKLEPKADTKKYASLALALSFILSVIFFFIISSSISIGIEVFALSFAMSFFLFLILPRLEFKRKVSEIEKEMPFALRNLGTMLSLHIPFQRCIALLAQEKSPIGREFAIINHEMERGLSFSKVLGERAGYLESHEIKRAFSQLISAYEEGTSGREIKRLGNELLAIRSHRLKEYAGKSAMVGLLFIMAAAILPTFFLVIAGLGMTSPLTESEIILAMLVFFPLLIGTVALFGKAIAPDPVFSSSEKVSYLPLLAALPLSIAAYFFDGALLAVALIAAIAGIAYLVYPAYKKEKDLEEIEAHLPDALLMASGLPKGSSLDRIFENIARNDYGKLSKEAEISLRQLQAMVKPEDVLHDFSVRNPLQAIISAMDLIKHAFFTNHLERLNEIAEDLLNSFEIRREREALLSVQKYTLILGAVIVPLILKNAISLISRMSAITGSETTTIAVASAALPAYMIMYALLAGYYTADLESKSSHALLYFVAMSSISLGVIYIS